MAAGSSRWWRIRRQRTNWQAPAFVAEVLGGWAWFDRRTAGRRKRPVSVLLWRNGVTMAMRRVRALCRPYIAGMIRGSQAVRPEKFGTAARGRAGSIDTNRIIDGKCWRQPALRLFCFKGRLGCNRSLCRGNAVINIKSRHGCEANTEAGCTALANKVEPQKIGAI